MLCFRHPDKNPDNVDEAKVQFQKVTAAYERLTDQADLSDEDSDEDSFGWNFGEDGYYEAEDLFCNMWYALEQPSLCFTLSTLHFAAKTFTRSTCSFSYQISQSMLKVLA